MDWIAVYGRQGAATDARRVGQLLPYGKPIEEPPRIGEAARLPFNGTKRGDAGLKPADDVGSGQSRLSNWTDISGR